MKWIKTLKNITENGGSTVILECQVQSSYPISFNWYRYNNPLDKSRFITDQSTFRSSIRLNNLKESEAGFYTCEVSNGFQTISSTGFVRVKNPVDIDHIDLNDDSLPSIDFQPEIIANNDGSVNKLKCELYSGNICRSIIGSQYISSSNSNQKNLEQNLIENLQILTNNQFLSNECRQLLLPIICSFTYSICDQDRLNVRSICRHSCNYFQNHACKNLFSYQQQTYSNLQILQNIPTCENLPPTSDESSCINFDQIISNRQNNSSSNTRTIINRPPSSSSSSSTSLLIVLLSILIPVALICFLMLFFCWCCHQRNNNSHLSSCSSTSTPIKKTSHLVNTVTSSPFRSSITTHNIKQNQHHIIPSSSSSTNTNFTNTYLRQTLLKNETKRPIIHLPLPGPSLSEISFTNIRFLQEIGDGEYGKIYKGELIDNANKCLIKTLQIDYATQQNREEYAREIEIFRHIRHINISCLLGICVQPQNALSLMIYERLNDGDLHEYLLQRSTTLYQQRDLNDYLYISIQILSGMIYLTEKNFVHNDLSAKNILISEHMDVKISNIARYRTKYDSDYYKIANRSLPVRWMAIESLLSGIYTEMSDVWSFGVLLWEMFSYGTQPYYGRTNPEVIEMIRDRKLLTCPINCPKRIYALMCACWEELSEQRPTFIELMGRIRQFEEKTITTLSSTTSSSLIDVPPVINQGDIQSPKYRTFISPPPISSFARNETNSINGRIPVQSTLVDRDNIRFEV
ncbi:unnamed protein product [Adineta steineri]|uniref:Receptor protein-tyrosine kinase n=1 Tax=Adineta steineri TaxID=433720 RepID=A0A818K1S3_9BILA|nr:unnamed protein product [Adineta steineri]